MRRRSASSRVGRIGGMMQIRQGRERDRKIVLLTVRPSELPSIIASAAIKCYTTRNFDTGCCMLLLVRGNKDALVLFLYVCFPHRIRKEDRTMKHPVMLANMPDGRSIACWSVFWCHMDTELFCRASCRFLVKFEMTDSLSLSLSLMLSLPFPYPWNYST